MWTAYKHGHLDLTTAALATNTAFELLRRAEEELLEELDTILPPELRQGMKGYEGIQRFLYVMTAESRGQSPAHRKSPGDPYNYELWDIAEWTCLPVYIALATFVSVLQPDTIPVWTPGHFGQINLNGDVLSPNDKFTQDQVFHLERFIPEVMYLLEVAGKDKQLIRVPAEDELTSGIIEMVRTKKISIWLVLACQVQLDIHYVLLKDMKRPFVELSVAAKRAKDAAESYLAYTKDITIGNAIKDYDLVLRVFLREWDQWISRDFLNGLRTRQFAQLGIPKQGSFVLLKVHPVLCGLMLFRMKLLMQNTGLFAVNGWGALPTILHLYNACAAEGLLEEPWMDLEAIIETHTAKKIFVGDRPQSLKDYMKRFTLVSGYSASIHAMNRRKHVDLQFSKAGPRRLLTDSPIAEAYQDRFLGLLELRDHDQRRARFTLASIEKLLGEVARDTMSDEKKDDRAATSFMQGRFKSVHVRNRRITKTGPPTSLQSHRLTNIQFLMALEAYMTEQTFAFSVDYFTLHIRCANLLRAIQRELDATFVKHYGPRYLGQESTYPFLVGYIFMRASKAAEINGADVSERLPHGARITSRILREASRVIARFIEKEGSADIDAVRASSRVFAGFEAV